MILPHYLRTLIAGRVYPSPSSSTPSPCYGYYITKMLYTRRVHNSFTESVNCETYKQTMNNFKLRTKYVSIHYAIFFENSCSRISTAEVLQCIFSEFTLQHDCSPVNLWHNLGTLFTKYLWGTVSGVSKF